MKLCALLILADSLFLHQKSGPRDSCRDHDVSHIPAAVLRCEFLLNLEVLIAVDFRWFVEHALHALGEQHVEELIDNQIRIESRDQIAQQLDDGIVSLTALQQRKQESRKSENATHVSSSIAILQASARALGANAIPRSSAQRRRAALSASALDFAR